jgi:hypothetical protein
MLPSPTTIKYFEALDREGDNFDHWRWLKRLKAENAQASAPKTASVAGLPKDAEFVVGPSQASRSTARAPCVLKVSRSAKDLRGMTHAEDDEDQRDRLGGGLRRICGAWDDFQTSRDRDAVYGYLKSVYSLVMGYRSRRQTRRLMQRACDFAGFAFDKAADPFTTVIRCTSEKSLDHRTVSKWSRALRYAAYRNRSRRMLVAFMKAVGGINACASRHTQVLGKGSKSS